MRFYTNVLAAITALAGGAARNVFDLAHFIPCFAGPEVSPPAGCL